MAYAQQSYRPGQQPYIQQQPTTTHAMALTGGNRNAKSLPVDGEGREWSEGICGCCGDAGTCVVALCCPCIIYGRNKQRLDHLQSKGAPNADVGCCSGDCMIHGLITAFCGVGWILQFINRGSVRSRYNIKGGACGDCCASFWCMPCALTQEAQEIKLEERSFGAYH